MKHLRYIIAYNYVEQKLCRIFRGVKKKKCKNEPVCYKKMFRKIYI